MHDQEFVYIVWYFRTSEQFYEKLDKNDIPMAILENMDDLADSLFKGAVGSKEKIEDNDLVFYCKNLPFGEEFIQDKWYNFVVPIPKKAIGKSGNEVNDSFGLGRLINVVPMPPILVTDQRTIDELNAIIDTNNC